MDSTNNYAKRIAEQGAETGTLVVAEEQTGGKGRRGRSWETPKGANIAMTILLKPPDSPRACFTADPSYGYGGGQGDSECDGTGSWHQMANDVVVDGHKVCGILTEMSTEVDYINYVVIGTGINVNQTEFPGRDPGDCRFLKTGSRTCHCKSGAGCRCDGRTGRSLWNIFKNRGSVGAERRI